MVKKNKGLVLCLFAFLLAGLGGFLFTGCSKTQEISYITSVEDFNLKFQTQKVLYVDDLDFGTDTMLEVNRSVKFVGKKDKSTLSKVFFNITAPYVAGKRICVEFENIVFDGGFQTNVDLTQDATFATLLDGDRSNKHCIAALIGHFDLRINNCEFTNYASQFGSVVFVDTVEELSTETKQISINNSKFYGNICHKGTVNIQHARANTQITNCEFFQNYGTVGTGFYVSNGSLFANECVVRDNIFCRFASGEEGGQNAGGGVHVGGVDGKMCNTKILNNQSMVGGGLSLGSKNTGDGPFTLENCTIKGNTATTSGGGVIINSEVGQTVSFIGCEISFNHAPSSANVCSITRAGWRSTYRSGNVNFFFCKIAMNGGIGTEETDSKGIVTDLDFHVAMNPTKLPNPAQNANTQVKGCIIIDKTTLTANKEDYNYIATPQQAEQDGVIDMAQMPEKTLLLLDNEKTNISVPASVYSLWDMEFVGMAQNAQMGEWHKPPNNQALVAGLAALLAGVMLAAFVFAILRRPKFETAPSFSQNTIQNVQPKNSASQTPSAPKTEKATFVGFSKAEIEKIVSAWPLAHTLSKKEKDVFRLRLASKKRKEIAGSLFVSENTIKKHIAKIYTKIGVSTWKELASLAKQYLNSENN